MNVKGDQITMFFTHKDLRRFASLLFVLLLAPLAFWGCADKKKVSIPQAELQRRMARGRTLINETQSIKMALLTTYQIDLDYSDRLPSGLMQNQIDEIKKELELFLSKMNEIVRIGGTRGISMSNQHSAQINQNNATACLRQIPTYQVTAGVGYLITRNTEATPNIQAPPIEGNDASGNAGQEP